MLDTQCYMQNSVVNMGAGMLKYMHLYCDYISKIQTERKGDHIKVSRKQGRREGKNQRKKTLGMGTRKCEEPVKVNRMLRR